MSGPRRTASGESPGRETAPATGSARAAADASSGAEAAPRARGTPLPPSRERRLRAALRARALGAEARLLDAAGHLLALAGLEHLFRVPVPAPAAPPGSETGLRVLFVCQGNICRSAYAEAALRRALAEDADPSGAPRGSAAVEVASAGLETREGGPADPAAVRVAASRGVDLGAHRTRPLRRELLAAADLVLAMEPRHLRALRRRFPGAGPRPGLLGAFALSRGGPLVIRDPFGGDDPAFAACFDAIDRAVAELAPELTSAAAGPEAEEPFRGAGNEGGAA